jgi:hypothetical protein
VRHSFAVTLGSFAALLGSCREAPEAASDPSPTAPTPPVEPKGSSVALEVDEAVREAEARARRVAPPAPVRGVVADSKSACAWLVDDRVLCWGSDAGGSIGDGSEIADTPEERARPYPVPVIGLPSGLQRFGRGWAITKDGATVLWRSVMWMLEAGDSYFEYRTAASPWSLPPAGIVDLALASGFGCVLTGEGQAQCAGASVGLGDGSTYSRALFRPVPLPGRAMALSAGGSRACAVIDDGTVRCWGQDLAAPKDPAPLGCGEPVPALPSGPSAGAAPPTQMFDPCASTTHIDRLPVAIAGITDAIDVEVGDDGWACAIVRGGGVACWGRGDQGELGDGTYEIRMDARPVPGLRGPVVQLAGNYYRVCARHEAGTVDCWGSGHTPPTPSPIPVPIIDDAIDVSVGDDACVVRRSDANVWCWGWREAGFGDDPERKLEVPSPLLWGKP